MNPAGGIAQIEEKEWFLEEGNTMHPTIRLVSVDVEAMPVRSSGHCVKKRGRLCRKCLRICTANAAVGGEVQGRRERELSGE